MKASDHESYTVLTLISFIIPIIGLILGTSYLTKDKKLDKKLGEHLIAFSIFSLILWGVAYVIFINVTAVNSIQSISL